MTLLGCLIRVKILEECITRRQGGAHREYEIHRGKANISRLSVPMILFGRSCRVGVKRLEYCMKGDKKVRHKRNNTDLKGRQIVRGLLSFQSQEGRNTKTRKEFQSLSEKRIID